VIGVEIPATAIHPGELSELRKITDYPVLPCHAGGRGFESRRSRSCSTRSRAVLILGLLRGERWGKAPTSERVADE
jgi:hypothetical protein